MLKEILIPRGTPTVGGAQTAVAESLELVGEKTVLNFFSIIKILENTCSRTFFNKKPCHTTDESQK